MNSVIRPIFNKCFVEKRYLWVPWTMHGIHWKVHNPTCGALLQKKEKKKRKKLVFIHIQTMRLDWRRQCSVCVFLFFFFSFFYWRAHFTWECLLVSPVHCAQDPPPLWQSKFSLEWHCSVGPVYCSRDPQTSLFSNFFIKNGFHGTIHTFKNYFATVFSFFIFQQNKQYSNGL